MTLAVGCLAVVASTVVVGRASLELSVPAVVAGDSGFLRVTRRGGALGASVRPSV